MIFNVKSINTVDNAGKQVDGMKRPREPPTGGNRMDIGRILPTEAAAILSYGIPGRGVHYGKKYMRKWLDSYDGKKFFVLKMDVHHFFESINRRILKRKLKAVIRDKRFYRLLCILIEHDKIALVAKILTDAGVEIDAEQTKTLVGCIAFDDISGALEVLREIGIAGAMFEELKIIIEEMRKGVPLGYFTSQWFGNFYLKALDHYIKEELHAEHYMRYMDDMVILGKSKKKLHKMHRAIETYLNDNLDLEIKGDWQVFRFEYPVMKDGKPVLDENRKQVTKGRMLDFMGFQFHHDRTTIRKSNIESARRKANHISKQDKISWYNASVMLSYMGLFKHTDTYNYYIEYIKPKINDKKVSGLFMKRVVFTLILAAFIFTVVMIFVFLRMGSEPSTLIENVFRFLSVEGGAMALIKSVKTVKGTKSNGEIQHNDEPEQDDEEVQG